MQPEAFPFFKNNTGRTSNEAISVFPFFDLLNLSIFFEILVLFFNKYLYGLCVSVNMETRGNISLLPVLVTICITHLLILMAK